MDRARIEQFVIEVAQARGLIDADSVAQVRSAHQSQGGDVLALLAGRLDPERNRVLSAIYQQALASEGAQAAAPAATTPSAYAMTPAPAAAALDYALTPAPGAAAPVPSSTPDMADYVKTIDSGRMAAVQADGRTGWTRAQGSHPPASGAQDPDATVGVAVPGGANPGEISRLGPYEIKGELGRGGMGIVYDARDTRSGERVALKVLLAGQKASADEVKRFQIEATAARRLAHPNLVNVIDHGQSIDGKWFMAMEYVEGEDLADVLKEDGPLDAEEAAEIVRDVADALAYAHEQDILHRDLKPQNIMLEEDGTPRLTDFGLAKLRNSGDVSLTNSGTLLGTPAYMSPEQANGEKRLIDERTDVYGLGATLYHMLTGRPPFTHESMTRLLMAIVNEKPPKPSELIDIDRDLETIVLKCLAKDPADRYPTADKLARDLTRWLKALDIVARPPTASEQAQEWIQSHREVVAGVVGAAAVLLLVAGFAFRGGQEPQTAQDERDNVSSSETDPAPSQADTSAPPSPTQAPELPPKPTQPTQGGPEDLPPRPRLSPTPNLERPGPDRPGPDRPGPDRPGPDHPGPDHPAPPQPRPTPPTTQPPTETRQSADLPEWARRRLTPARRLIVAPSWREAQAEARAWNVPILVAGVNHETERLEGQLLADPAAAQLLNRHCVLVLAQGPHPPHFGRQGGRRGPPGQQGGWQGGQQGGPPNQGGRRGPNGGQDQGGWQGGPPGGRQGGPPGGRQGGPPGGRQGGPPGRQGGPPGGRQGPGGQQGGWQGGPQGGRQGGPGGQQGGWQGGRQGGRQGGPGGQQGGWQGGPQGGRQQGGPQQGQGPNYDPNAKCIVFGELAEGELSCSAHVDPMHSTRAAFDPQGTVQYFVCNAQGRVMASSGNDFQVSDPRSLGRALADVQRRLGPPRLTPGDFDAAPEALDAEPGAQRGQASSKAVFERLKERPGPLGDWARFVLGR